MFFSVQPKCVQGRFSKTIHLIWLKMYCMWLSLPCYNNFAQQPKLSSLVLTWHSRISNGGLDASCDDRFCISGLRKLSLQPQSYKFNPRLCTWNDSQYQRIYFCLSVRLCKYRNFLSGHISKLLFIFNLFWVSINSLVLLRLSAPLRFVCSCEDEFKTFALKRAFIHTHTMCNDIKNSRLNF